MEIKEKIFEFKVVCNSDRELFLKKLTVEQGWSPSFAKCAFVEYKRFIYLATISEDRIVPSKIIDKVWHLHLTFTKSYWQDLCRDLIGKEIHHTPSLADKASRTRDISDYQYTLNLYKSEFGTEAPRRYWPRPGIGKRNVRNPWLPVIGASALLTACSAISNDDIKSVIMWGGGIYILYRVLKWLSSHNTGGGSGGSGGGGFGCSNCGSSCGGGCGGGS